MRLLHHPKSTEDAYVGQLNKFIRHVDDHRLEKYGEAEIGDFLTDLAVTQQVSAGTQNQALCGILFFYERVHSANHCFHRAELGGELSVLLQ